ncbi:hypothetical protein NP233_g2615 [Leucocoprinus birnbaumii]|uniref:Uncharacterized protein n=1 Tax=Leucocoprinus birnbaumii TaxID=56174 RepID=A0AAD5YX54_9AGAR|nr:hypothetical protein NP233_g2615 [Leucocoprinus birnbaumii]
MQAKLLISNLLMAFVAASSAMIIDIRPEGAIAMIQSSLTDEPTTQCIGYDQNCGPAYWCCPGLNCNPVQIGGGWEMRCY